ncbi:zinc finger CCHC domain-containing protein 8 homolog [Drosophila ananassae]|uniref:zinc finger CCHC domain-containing protein 8 homolog n=1 Tax=Drosophila ananassae TaxID=7217 RepID=UPI0013A5CDD5|nr:zinc finger CCHC domain-containing protein 8 homolog [Drosophila ananassae]
MDDSVIFLDDTLNSVEIIDADVEDGELEDEVEIVPLENAATNVSSSAAKSETEKNDQETTSDESNNLVFEVRFRNIANFKSLKREMLQVLGTKFSDKNFEYKTDPKLLVISAYEKIDIPEEEPSSPAPDLADLFMIDTQPAEKLIASQVPSYKRCNADVLDEATEERKRRREEAVNKCFRPKAQSSCFNCGDTDHSLRECPKPRNNARIQRARKNNSSTTKRYHVETAQRFGHIRPGKISTKTRHAMGYTRRQLPFMFYRMRVLGYPPAWLEEARVQSSGIALFNADGTEVSKSDEEEGESDAFKYDINKIVEYPGFNVDPGDKYFDDFRHHNVPPYQESYSKEHFIKSLGENVINGYRRKKLVDLPAPHDEVTPPVAEPISLGECDMEVVDEAEDPPLPPSTNLALPPPPPPPPSKERPPSPSLEDLRAQQEKLLEQLECNTSLDTTANDSKSLINLDSSTDIESVVEPTDVPQTQSAPPTPTGTRGPHQAFKASFEGTPVLKFSVYDKLPVGSNFKVGVSDVINFENLPDSTGKYEQMKDLLKNVRDKMDKLQKET